jgi:hypothetical protein
MTKTRQLGRILAGSLCCLALVFSLAGFTSAIDDNGAGDLNAASGAISSGELIQITVPEQLEIIDFQVIEPSVGATTTNNSHIKVAFDVKGSGTMTITDQNGNVLWTGTRTETAVGHYEVELNLPGVGDYQLTLTHENLALVLSDTANISIVYEPVLPGLPDTGAGYVYIGGYAVPSYMIFVPISILAIVFFIIWRKRDKKQGQ